MRKKILIYFLPTLCLLASIFFKPGAIDQDPINSHDTIVAMAKKNGITVEPQSHLPGVHYTFKKFSDEKFSEKEHPRNHSFERENGQKPTWIIVHDTCENLGPTFGIFTSGKEPRVNAHYVISEKEIGGAGEDEIPGGQVIQMVDPVDLARHAGESAFRGKVKYNNHAIGIELVGRGPRYSENKEIRFFTFNDPENLKKTRFPSYDKDQIRACFGLIKILCEKYGIPKENIVSHGDVAPQRKYDVTIRFPWAELFQEGYGMGLTKNELQNIKSRIPSTFNRDVFIQSLKKLGYDMSFCEKKIGDKPGEIQLNGTESDDFQQKFKMVCLQFYAHFSRNGESERWNGDPDHNDMAWAAALAEKYQQSSSDDTVKKI
jgi:N-acetyl-anhydromuramyl-L-alanine amidase AmpD